MTHFRRGRTAELFLLDKLRDRGLEVEHFPKRYYDIMINKHTKLEVKSCLLSVRQKGRNNKDSWRAGRFIIPKEQLTKLKKNKVWICFIIRFKHNCMILGISPPNFITPITKYIRYCELRTEPLLDLDQFVNIVKKIK